jgi:histidyl-tRNA synthetase
MIPDAEIISLLGTILTKLEVGDFTIKLNNRKILDGIFEVCGVPSEKIRSISSAVDKLDKLPWEEVKKEMTQEKGLDPTVADKIGQYVKLKGVGLEEAPKLLEKLLQDSTLTSNKSAKAGLSDMETLFTLLKSYGILDKISFDMSLARGLDYYTGIIYEAVVEASAPPGFKQADALASTSTSEGPAPTSKTDSKKPKKKVDEEGEEEIDESQVGVGSIAAGGRYDNLVGMFSSAASGEGKKTTSIPCVGVSMGLDRIFAIIWPKWIERGMRSKGTMVYVMSAGDGLLQERVQLVQALREAGINTEFSFRKKPKLPAQFAAGEKDEVPFAVILGGDELKAGLVTVKEQKWEFKDGQKVKVQSEEKGTQIPRDQLIDWIKNTQTFRDWQIGQWIS